MEFLLRESTMPAEAVALNTATMTWPVSILPVFDDNAMLLESVKQRSEQHLVSKREKLLLEIEKVLHCLLCRPELASFRML